MTPHQMHRRKLLGSGAVKMTCPAGTTAVSIAHAPMQRPDYFFSSPACSRGCGLDPLHLLPSPTVSMPKNGAWNGAPGRSEIDCDPCPLAARPPCLSRFAGVLLP